jgi:uncharacterized RDD family membrane protein YckC
MAPYAPPQPARPTLASFGARLGSRLIDTVVAGGVAVVVALVALAIFLLAELALYLSVGHGGGAGLLQPWHLVALLLLSWLIAVPIIRIGGEGNRPGQTLGKAAAGIRVVRDDEDGSRAGYGPAFGRFFLNLVPVLSLLTCLSMLWSPDGRCWHDAWTGTRVEKSPVPARARANRWNPPILAACLALALAVGIPALLGGLNNAFSASGSSGSTGYSVNPYGYGTDPGGAAGNSAPEQTAPPAEAPPAATETAPASPTRAAPPAEPGSTSSADLGLAEPISRPGCDGEYAVFVGAAVKPLSYATDVQRLLGQHPGSSYVFTPASCTSLRSHVENGNDIYAVFYGPYATSQKACARKSAAGVDAYVRRLDKTTPPGTRVCGR